MHDQKRCSKKYKLKIQFFTNGLLANGLWSLADDPRLGAKTREIIALSNRSELVISDIVFIEVAYLHDKGRIESEDGLDALLAKISDSFLVVPITGEIASIAVSLDLAHGDPFDRVISATAITHGIPLLTRDRKITACDAVLTLW